MSTAIITGGSRGLGRALGLELATSGWNLVIDARNQADLAAAADEIDTAGTGRTVAMAGDVTDVDHARALVTAAIDLGAFKLLVNNASTLGTSPLPAIADYPLEDFAEVLEVNVIAPLRLIQVALPELRSAGGKVLNITSDAGIEGYEGWGGYGASKAALEQLSNVLAVEEPTVRVYWVDPGDMQTRMHQDAFPGEDISDRALPQTQTPALVRLIEDDYPSGRYRANDLLAAATPR